MSQLFDVIAVNIATGAERLMSANRIEADADAFRDMAVLRRGVEEEFFKTVPAGTPLKPGRGSSVPE